MQRINLLVIGVMLMVVLAGCDRGDNTEVVVPTVADAAQVQTSIAQTQYAPPPGFGQIAFNPIDYNLESLPGRYYEIAINFDGQYTQTTQPTNSVLLMKVWENGLLRARRVVLNFIGDALSGGVSQVEAVRVGNDFYLVDATGVCAKNSPAATEIATLSAGAVVGGVTLALPIGRPTEINGYQGYQYGFAAENLVINIFQQPPSAMALIGGEVWVLPELNVVGRFGVSMNVHNALILFGTQPVTGNLRYQYNLYGVFQNETELPNIALPNGC